MDSMLLLLSIKLHCTSVYSNILQITFQFIKLNHYVFLIFFLTYQTGKSLEWGLRKEGLLKAVRELDGNERESCEALLKDVSMYARGKIIFNCF